MNGYWKFENNFVQFNTTENKVEADDALATCIDEIEESKEDIDNIEEEDTFEEDDLAILDSLAYII